MAVQGHGLAPNRTSASGFRGPRRTILITPTALCRGRSRHDLGGLIAARAAVGLRRLGLAVRRLFADQGAFGLLAVGRTVALPVAERLLADRLARGRRVGAFSVAGGLLADRVAFRAGALLAVLDRAAHLALRLVAFDLTFRAPELLAPGRAARLLANRLADLVADRRRALPLASVGRVGRGVLGRVSVGEGSAFLSYSGFRVVDKL
jgi:hypothetical protein